MRGCYSGMGRVDRVARTCVQILGMASSRQCVAVEYWTGYTMVMIKDTTVLKHACDNYSIV